MHACFGKEWLCFGPNAVSPSRLAIATLGEAHARLQHEGQNILILDRPSFAVSYREDKVRHRGTFTPDALLRVLYRSCHGFPPNGHIGWFV